MKNRIEGKIKYAYVSHKGLIRKLNQDNYLIDFENMKPGNEKRLTWGKCISEKSFFAVFDGMGGEQCGEMASFLAAESMKKTLCEMKSYSDCNPESIKQAIISANKCITDYMDENKLLRMGTTLASIYVDKDKVLMANVGDSRVFKIGKNELKQLSLDHTAIAPMGKKAPLYQYLGIRDGYELEPHIIDADYEPGSRYLICSDGLTDMVENDKILETVNRYRVSKSCRLLLKQALKNGGKDNVTIVIIELL